MQPMRFLLIPLANRQLNLELIGVGQEATEKNRVQTKETDFQFYFARTPRESGSLGYGSAETPLLLHYHDHFRIVTRWLSGTSSFIHKIQSLLISSRKANNIRKWVVWCA
jgi:hypothetical protein